MPTFALKKINGCFCNLELCWNRLSYEQTGTSLFVLHLIGFKGIFIIGSLLSVDLIQLLI